MIFSKFYLYTKQADIFSCLIYGSLKIGKSNNEKAGLVVTFLELRVTSPFRQLHVTRYKLLTANC